MSLNIFLPIIILTKLTGEGLLGPVNGFIIAVSLPAAYGAYDFLSRRKFNVLSALGLAGVGLTAAIGVMGLDPGLVAVKEAAVPLVIGLTVLASTRTRWHFSRKLAEKALDMDRIMSAVKRKGGLAEFSRKMDWANVMVAGVFFFSAALNYALASSIVVSQPGTVEFNEELGYLAALSLPAIALPSVAAMGIILWRVATGISSMTGIKIGDMIRKV